MYADGVARPHALSLAVLALSACAASGCEVVYPGTAVGSFDVVGALDENACGAAVPANDPITFAVEIRADGARAYLRFFDPPTREGLLEADGTYRFGVSSQFQVIAPDPALGVVGCALEQREVLEARLSDAPTPDGGVIDDGGMVENDDAAAPTEDAAVADGGDGGMPDGGMPDLVLDGESEITFTPISGSDCTALLSVYGGPWSTLPCVLRYTLRGTSRAPL